MSHEKKEHPNKMRSHDSKHYLERVEERNAKNHSITHILGNFFAEYGIKNHPNAEPRPLPNRNRRAFMLLDDRGLQGKLYILDATDTKAVKVTVQEAPNDEWGPLAEKYRQNWIKAHKKKGN